MSPCYRVGQHGGVLPISSVARHGDAPNAWVDEVHGPLPKKFKTDGGSFMKFTQLTVTTIAACLIMQAPVRAQFVVTDPGNTYQAAITAGATILNYAKTAQMLEQTIAMVGMFTTTFAVTGLLSQLNQGNKYPSTNKLSEQMFDSQRPVSATARAIATDRDRAVDGSDAHAELLRGQITGAANAASVAADNLELMDKRLRENGNTLGQLSAFKEHYAGNCTNGCFSNRFTTQSSRTASYESADDGHCTGRPPRCRGGAAQRRERLETAKIFSPWTIVERAGNAAQIDSTRPTCGGKSQTG